MNIELTIDNAFKGKATRIKNKEYFSTEAYLEPFINRMSKYTDDFRIQGVVADQISLNKEGNIDLEDIVYNRIWIQAVMPSDLCFENHEEVIGMVYGLDVRKPITKIYRGHLNKACTNLCVFSPSFLDVQEIEENSPIDYKPIDRVMSLTCDIKEKLERMSNIEVEYNNDSINEMLGDWIRKTMHYSVNNESGKIKLSPSTAISAYKLLYEDDKSPYFITENTSTDLFNIYNAFTQVITDSTRKDIMGMFEKTLLIGNILNI